MGTLTSVKQGIAQILKRVNPDMDGRDVIAMTSHLLSPNVGVQRLTDLASVTADMLPASVSLSMIMKAKLLKAFENVTGEAEINMDESRPGPSRNQEDLRTIRDRRAQDIEFNFTVPWSDLAKETLRDELQSYKERNKKAPWSLVNELKKAIMIKLVEAWLVHRSNHPEVTRKNPGRQIYRSIGTQVYNKYGSATDITINDMFMATGESNFVKKLEEAVENKIKKLLPSTAPQKATRAVGTVGVLLEEYAPGVPPREKESLESVKNHLKMVHAENPDHYDWPTILQDMQQTYSMQREDIVKARKIIEEHQEASKKKRTNTEDEPDEEEDIDAELEERQMPVLVENWPFLFSYAGLNQHATKLTGRNLENSFTRFEEDHFEYLTMYLITSTKVNLTNLIIKHKVEKKLGPVTSTSVKFMIILEMLSNHFDEDLDSLILTCEATTDIDLLPFTLLDDRGVSPCIVALDQDMYLAKTFLVCADKTVLIQVKNLHEALIALVNVCFVFDLHYPLLPKLFEFIERFIFKMGLIDSKILSKGKQIGVITEPMRKLSDTYEALRAQIIEKLRDN